MKTTPYTRKSQLRKASRKAPYLVMVPKTDAPVKTDPTLVLNSVVQEVPIFKKEASEVDWTAQYLEASKRLRADDDLWKDRHKFWTRLTNNHLGVSAVILTISVLGPANIRNFTLIPLMTIMLLSVCLLVWENYLSYQHAKTTVTRMKTLIQSIGQKESKP